MKVRTISVVTVCLNARDCIRLTLNSVASQTFGNVEHVLIDGGSTDGTVEIVQECQPGYFISEKDDGIYPAMEKGAQAASGDILIFLNAGDTFYDDCVCEDIAGFLETTDADIVFGDLMPVYLYPSDLHDHEAFTEGKLIDLGYMMNRRQLYDESIHHQATFYRRWIFDACSYLCESPEANGEYNLLMCAAFEHNASIKHISRVVSRFVLGGISTQDFEKEWRRYVRAREILRSIYCPTKEKIKITNDHEFCGVKGIDKMQVTSRKHRLKQFIKRSIFFKVYDRLAFNLSERIINGLLSRTIPLQNEYAEKTSNEIRVVVEQSRQMQRDFQAEFEGIKAKVGAVNSSVEDVKASVDSVEGLVTRGFVMVDREMDELRRRSTRLGIEISRITDATNSGGDFNTAGYKVFSQWDEDGLIQNLISCFEVNKNVFVEIGVGDYSEANTRLLLEKGNWTGVIFDCNADNLEKLQSSDLYWRFSIKAITAFVDAQNINGLLTDAGMDGDIGLLSIDVDGVDYWIWKAIDVISPQIVICEYNGIFGSKAKVTVPYDPAFDRTKKHYSWLYAGASFAALDYLGVQKGYTCVGTNCAGNNAFFVRNDILARRPDITLSGSYRKPVFRESRNPDGSLSYMDVADSVALIGEMEVMDVDTGVLKNISSLNISYS